MEKYSSFVGKKLTRWIRIFRWSCVEKENNNQRNSYDSESEPFERRSATRISVPNSN